jgi:hypothetical protein|tara:strand:+ start:230 stop:709 length:480 start_codon:yes stop_codon:yes gene_type:complete
MNPSESLQLKKMINENNVEDLTDDIRTKKHSTMIRTDVTRMIELKKKYPRLEKSNSEQFDNMLTSQCSFLFNNYTDIFNKVKKNEINLETLWQLLNILRRIEDGDVDQHTGSYEVGKLLKKIYIDSALAKDNKSQSKTKKLNKPTKKKISWSEFKKINE